MYGCRYEYGVSFDARMESKDPLSRYSVRSAVCVLFSPGMVVFFFVDFSGTYIIHGSLRIWEILSRCTSRVHGSVVEGTLSGGPVVRCSRAKLGHDGSRRVGDNG